MANAIKGNAAGLASQIFANRLRWSEIGMASYVQGISIGGVFSQNSDGTFGRNIQLGVIRNNTEGSPNAPSLELHQAGFWRFRWAVTTGTRTIQINVKQPANLVPYPSLIIKQNPDIGINADVTGSSPGGTGWAVIGPVSITPNATGIVWVELWNNCYGSSVGPAYFDHIVVT